MRSAAPRLACRIVRYDTDEPRWLVRGHAESCLHCQADAARHRRIVRALRSMRTQLVEAPVALAADVEAHLDRPFADPGARSLVGAMARTAGAMAATVAGACALVAWRRTHPAV